MTEIDFVLIRKQHQLLLQNVKTFRVEIQHVLEVADIDKNSTTCSEKAMC